MLHRYSRWDGSQAFGDLDADDVLDEIADDVLGYGDLKSALQRLLQQGIVQQVYLAHGEVVGRAPVGVHAVQLGLVEGTGFGRHTCRRGLMSHSHRKAP